VIVLKKENIVEYPTDEKEYPGFNGTYDNLMFTIQPTIRLEGNILLVAIFKSQEMRIFSRVENDEVIISASVVNDNTLSTQYNIRGQQKIVGLINGDYNALMINKAIDCDILVLIPNDIL
jgi:hypothetical protein